MKATNELDVVVYGASGYTGRLVCEYLADRYPDPGQLRWGMAGRSADKLAQVRDEIGASKDTPIIFADAADPQSLEAMIGRAKAVISTVGPYQIYGSELVAACAQAGVDYLDLCGEPNWMRQMIDAHEAQAKASGARILFSCGYDSTPFELGVYFCQEAAKAQFGAPARQVKGRVRGSRGWLSGGTAASGAATGEAMQKDPRQMEVMLSPFGLTPGFEGPQQPTGMEAGDDPDVGPVSPFMMAVINTKNVHRSNYLMGHAYGADFIYDEMTMGVSGPSLALTDLGKLPGGGPKPGEGPTKEQRDAGYFDLLFIGTSDDGRKVRVSVKGDKDPGYGSTSKMLAETAICLVNSTETPGGIWTPGAALRGKLSSRLEEHAGVKFEVE
ncbi:MAG: saccharopine dehydrogenase [Gammaproteobacteria bacterium]|nr:MAG: saccharopine dehydrogenase [Gammaproteobacteria bacterium]